MELLILLKGKERWPDKPSDRDILYFLAQSFRSHLIKELPEDKDNLQNSQKDLVHRAKCLLKELASISLEIAQMVVTKDENEQVIADWFLLQVIRDLPRLAN